MYEENSSCGNNKIGKIIRNSGTRFSEQKILNGKSEPSIHFKNNFEHEFSWNVVKELLNLLKQENFNKFISERST